MVPDIEGPTHRYMLGSPGCWAVYASILAQIPGTVTGPHGALIVDAYAVQHPGLPTRQATQSIWVHLLTLQLALEDGWPTERLVAIRRLGADASAAWPWLLPPASTAAVTATDVVRAGREELGHVVRMWVDGAWLAWSDAHPEVRRRGAELIRRLG